MTIDEAIEHCEEIAQDCKLGEKPTVCADEHQQLAEWLKELKEYQFQNQERTTKVECIAEVYRDEIVDHYLSGICGICGESIYDHAKYCSDCGAKLDWSGNE